MNISLNIYAHEWLCCNKNSGHTPFWCSKINQMPLSFVGNAETVVHYRLALHAYRIALFIATNALNFG